MQLDHYISDLLYRYSCVTVPGFGSFLTQFRSARIHNHTFFPPSKAISFNAQLVSNDGLLIKHISGTEGLSYDETAKNVKKIALSWRESLEREEKLLLKNIGLLWLNKEGSIQFQPFTETNYLTDAFGLGSVSSREVTRETLKKEVAALEEKTPILFTPERRARKRSYLKYAAILLLSVSVGTIGYQSLKMEQQKEQLQIQMAEQEAQEELQRTIQQATFFDTTPMNLPSITLKATKKPLYYVVAGAFRVEENAEKKMEELSAKGYTPERLDPTRYGLHQVAFGSYTDAREAINFLNKVKTEAPEAWLLISEN
ncbi:SPOR domain-containing protein [Sinomicrobium pectinilyticum]|uniref:SPOR domain-containing protein n=1 Tax=Sinomicrobium pectinilyticum TaxID=1084421 RepID=A0A3N0ELE8_SINP1|nr:SPOR domain-containing protein [Sinomicrobium pectinilyticum]RNL88726.1 SPOR domain-containing protein [Sinomicrobium pectinilyticum]